MPDAVAGFCICFLFVFFLFSQLRIQIKNREVFTILLLQLLLLSRHTHMTSCSRLLSKQGMLKALYEIPQVLHLSVYEMQKVLCLHMSLISRYLSMEMNILQSPQYSDHVSVHITKSTKLRTYGHVTKSAVLRTCICTHYKIRSTQNMYLYILQSPQYSEYVDMLQSLQYSDHVYVHITKSVVPRTCICTHYEVCRQNMSGAQPSKEYSTCPRPTKYNKETNTVTGVICTLSR